MARGLQPCRIMKYLMIQYSSEYTSDNHAKYSIVECANELQKNWHIENASTDGLNPDYRVEMKRVRKNSLHDMFDPNKEYQPQEVRDILAEHGKKSALMYFNVYGWTTYLTTHPTFATPTGQCKGFPRRRRITVK